MMITALPSDKLIPDGPQQGSVLPKPQPCIIIGGRDTEEGKEVFFITCGPCDPIGPWNEELPTLRPYGN